MNSIPFCFGEKHRDYMRRCLGASVCVAEGAVRSGKTVDHVFVFAKLLEDAPDRLHLATGPTLGERAAQYRELQRLRTGGAVPGAVPLGKVSGQ